MLASRIVLFTSIVLAATAQAQTKKPYVPMDVQFGSAVWGWHLFDMKGNSLNKNRFRGTVEGKLTLNSKDIGTWKKSGKDGMTLDFTRGTLKGKAELKLVPMQRPTYQGTLVNDDGKFTLRIELVKD